MSAAPHPAQSHIPSTVTGSYPARDGNSVCPLVDGEAAFTRICEAVEAAQHSVWLTIAYLYPDFVMPGGRGSLFDVLDHAAARGVDVRVIFWRTDTPGEIHFHGTDDDHAMLAARGSKFHARWDRAQKHYCQHQKSWLMDAGHTNEIAFVGGINLDAPSLSPRGHGGRDGEHTHDVYVELRGPSATDVHHNFVQRWNEANERRLSHGDYPAGHTDALPFPDALSAKAGQTRVQIQRTIRPGQYTNGAAPPGGTQCNIADGERSVIEQYLAAIDAAREGIYIEDQYIASPDIVARLMAALKRGVDVIFVAPATPEPKVRNARADPKAKPFFDTLGSLGKHPNLTLAGIAAPQSDGALCDIYVHAKIMLVDDHWATIGSCNIASQSFFCDTEMNVSFWDDGAVRHLRAELFAEHLGTDTAHLPLRAAMKDFHAIACANAETRKRGERLQGLAYALDPAQYGA